VNNKEEPLSISALGLGFNDISYSGQIGCHAKTGTEIVPPSASEH